ncbi:unnamed protein product [Staurois parvus]|uniref:Uncharacterized protein n=1 Tax=Staurois parvus TaxID=386267 RepID=A0ABN9DDQ8_9NEOB|nr:unnamed protein product [Staurois parvus]
MKGTRGISWGPLLTPGPQAVPEFPNGQFAPGPNTSLGLNHGEHAVLWVQYLAIDNIV